MCRVWLGLVQVGPSQETASPVALPRCMVGHELMEVDWSVGLVECICALGASVICKSRRDRYTSSSE